MSANGLAAEAVTQFQNARNNIQASQTNNAAAVDNALSALAVYIPAEAMALYLALTASLPVISRDFAILDRTNVYWAFVLLLSPGLFVLAFLVKLAREKAGFPTAREFPWFRMMASILAFAVWGLCVPGSPFESIEHPGRGVLFGILATLVSILLPSVEAIYNWSKELQSHSHGGTSRQVNIESNGHSDRSGSDSVTQTAATQEAKA